MDAGGFAVHLGCLKARGARPTAVHFRVQCAEHVCHAVMRIQPAVQTALTAVSAAFGAFWALCALRRGRAVPLSSQGWPASTLPWPMLLTLVTGRA